MKSRLTGARRASNIVVPMIALMNGLRNGMVYDWASILSDRIHEFLMLKHKAFYMPFHAIGLFLEVVRTQVPSERHVWKTQNRVDPSRPPIFYWTHLDTFIGSGDIQPSRKQTRQQVVASESELESAEEEESNAGEGSMDTSSSSSGDNDAFHLASRGVVGRSHGEEKLDSVGGGTRVEGVMGAPVSGTGTLE